MFSNDDLEKMIRLAGVKKKPKLMESDHIDLEVSVEPEPELDAVDYGIPDEIGEPLAPAYEEPMDVDEYGIPLDNAMGDPDGEMIMVGDPQGEPMPGVGDNMMNQGMGVEMPAIGGMGGMSDMDGMDMEPPPDGEAGEVEFSMSGDDEYCPPCDDEEMPIMDDGEDMTSQFAAMPDDEFMSVIQDGMPDMDEIVVGDNQEGEMSPVGSDEEVDVEVDEDPNELEWGNFVGNHDEVGADPEMDIELDLDGEVGADEFGFAPEYDDAMGFLDQDADIGSMSGDLDMDYPEMDNDIIDDPMNPDVDAMRQRKELSTYNSGRVAKHDFPGFGEAVQEEYDYSNGYDENHIIDGEEYFPDGHDSNIRKKAGPIPKVSDNNMNVSSLPVNEVGDLAESLFSKYKKEYAKFLKENN